MENKAGKGKIGKTKLEEEKREHDLELELLKGKVRTGNWMREIQEEMIKGKKEISGTTKGIR